MTEDPRRGDLVGRFAARLSAARVPAVAWWVERRGVVLSRGVQGDAVREPRREPAGKTTPFDLASLTKPLCTALLLVGLDQDGRLSLDDPIERWLPESRGTPYEGRRLVELARHVAGFPAWAPLYLDARSEAEYCRAILTRPPAVPRGEELYSDLGYILLGFILERSAGRGLDALFAERIRLPLALRRTGFANRASYGDAAATEQGNAYERALAGSTGDGHAWRESLIRGVVHDANAFALGGVAGHAGLFGPLDEVATIARGLLAPPYLGLDERARSRLFIAPEGATRTVGWVTARGSRAARGILRGRAPGHTGFTGTSIWLDPDDGSLLLLLTNRVHPRVAEGSFQPVRRAFHRVARSALSGSPPAPPASRP